MLFIGQVVVTKQIRQFRFYNCFVLVYIHC